MLGIMALLHVWTVSVFIQLILTQHCWKGADCLNTNPIVINTWGFTRATEAGKYNNNNTKEDTFTP